MSENMMKKEGFTENSEEVKSKKRGLATASLVFGILALITTLFFVNYVFGFIGLILAIVYFCKKGKKYAKGRAITGLVCALLSIALSTSLWVGFYIYVTTTSITDIMDDVSQITGGEFNPEEIVNDFIQSNLPDSTAIEQIIGKELNYETLCEFVGEEVSIQTITNFVGDGIDPAEVEELVSTLDTEAVINDLGGNLTYKAMEEKIGEDFTYQDLKQYLGKFQK